MTATKKWIFFTPFLTFGKRDAASKPLSSKKCGHHFYNTKVYKLSPWDSHGSGIAQVMDGAQVMHGAQMTIFDSLLFFTPGHTPPHTSHPQQCSTAKRSLPARTPTWAASGNSSLGHEVLNHRQERLSIHLNTISVTVVSFE